MQEKQDTEVKFVVDVLKPNKIQLLCDTLYRMLSENNIIDYHMLENDHQNLVGSLQQMVQQIEGLELPPQKTRQCIRSDGGPGVGSNNHEVKFRMAQIARITNADIRIILRGSRGDSGQNEAEQTNSGVSNAVCDGGTIEWEKHQRFEGLTNEDIVNLTLDQYNKIEEQRDQRNAWGVASEVAMRVDGAPCMGEYMKARVAIKHADGFFWNKEYVEKFFKTIAITLNKKSRDIFI